MLILHDPVTLKHETVELLGAKLIPALESPARLESILTAVNRHRPHDLCLISVQESDSPWLWQIIHSTHDSGYLDHLRHCHEDWVKAGHITLDESILPECFPSFAMPSRNTALGPPRDIFARSGFYAFDMSSGIMKDTYAAVIASANLAIAAAYRLVDNVSMSAICALCRPPGHHCDTARAGGYCYLNNCVLATAAIRNRMKHRIGPENELGVSILDIDMHHGNGTQSFFYDGQVRYVSIHGEDEYPYYTGKRTETGSGRGRGYNHNFPLPQKTSESVYLATLNEALILCLQDKPEYVVISMGFDTFHLDPLGGFDLDTSSYGIIGRTIANKLAETGTRAVILLEGGYFLEALGKNLLAFLSGWDH